MELITMQDNFSKDNYLIEVKEECLEESQIVNNESFDINKNDCIPSAEKFYLS